MSSHISQIWQNHFQIDNVNFIAKLFNRIHNYGRTKTLETVMEGLNLICVDKEGCQTASVIVSQKKR